MEAGRNLLPNEEDSLGSHVLCVSTCSRETAQDYLFCQSLQVIDAFVLHVNDWDKVYVEQSDYAYKLYATPQCQEVQRFCDLPCCQPCQLLSGHICLGDLLLF